MFLNRKHSLIIALTIISVISNFSCKKETLANTNMINETIDSTAQLILKGSFKNGPYGTVIGNAEIYKLSNMFTVKLSNFNTSNGPALHVFLSKEAMPINFQDLGELKSTNGNQTYAVSSTPNFAEYKYISIHCVAYNHLFGYAELK